MIPYKRQTHLVDNEKRSRQMNMVCYTAEDQILDLAGAYDEHGYIELSQICRRIEELLWDTIEQGKVTEKRIEERSSYEYKNELGALTIGKPYGEEKNEDCYNEKRY